MPYYDKDPVSRQGVFVAYGKTDLGFEFAAPGVIGYGDIFFKNGYFPTGHNKQVAEGQQRYKKEIAAEVFQSKIFCKNNDTVLSCKPGWNNGPACSFAANFIIRSKPVLLLFPVHPS